MLTMDPWFWLYSVSGEALERVYYYYPNVLSQETRMMSSGYQLSGYLRAI
jgi:hypothetical protein